MFDEPTQPANPHAERDREILRLRLAAPMRRPAAQHDASELGLFRAADEPRLL